MLPTGTGWESVLALGTTRAEKAGYGWTGCSTYPMRATSGTAVTTNSGATLTNDIETS